MHLALWWYMSCLCWLTVVQAYGPSGHYFVAYLARHFSTNATRAKLDRLFTSDQALYQAANWADRIKSDPSYEWSFPLHYVNIQEPLDAHRPLHHAGQQWTWKNLAHWAYNVSSLFSPWPIGGLTYASAASVAVASGKARAPKEQSTCRGINLETDCRHGACIVTALANYSHRALQAETDSEDYITSLKFFIHFMGDAHHVLHLCGIQRGGNDKKVLYRSHWMNFHHLWDVALLETRVHHYGSPGVYMQHLIDKSLKKQYRWRRQQWILAADNQPCDLSLKGCFQHWLSEFHCQYAPLIWNLPSSPSIDLHGPAYSDHVISLLDDFLIMAGTRLAYIFDYILH